MTVVQPPLFGADDDYRHRPRPRWHGKPGAKRDRAPISAPLRDETPSYQPSLFTLEREFCSSITVGGPCEGRAIAYVVLECGCGHLREGYACEFHLAEANGDAACRLCIDRAMSTNPHACGLTVIAVEHREA